MQRSDWLIRLRNTADNLTKIYRIWSIVSPSAQCKSVWLAHGLLCTEILKANKVNGALYVNTSFLLIIFILSTFAMFSSMELNQI